MSWTKNNNTFSDEGAQSPFKTRYPLATQPESKSTHMMNLRVSHGHPE